jgi:TrwC relaxase
LAFIEKHALFTRTGPQGIRQVNVGGLVAAAFTHPRQPGRRPGSPHPRGGGE